MKITLCKLARVDLSIKYARDMGNGKIRHYSVPYSETLLGTKAIDLIRLHIMSEELLEPSEVEIEEVAIASLVAPNTNGSLNIEEVPVLDEEIKAALKKVTTTSTIHQASTISRKDRAINYLADLINPVVVKINMVLKDIQKLSYEDILDGKGYFMRGIIYRSPMIHIHPVRFLSVAFEANDYKEAKQALLNDLSILNNKDLILGNLAMPSLLAIADTVGSGQQQCVLFCFPIIDYTKMASLIGEANAKATLPLKYFGVKTESVEGRVNYLNGITPEAKYQIETVDVVKEKQQAQHKLILKTFEASLPKVSEAAAVTNAILMAYPEELAKARAELDLAVNDIQDKAFSAARKKVAKTTKKPLKRKKVAKKSSKKFSIKKKSSK